jgi:hypothetical protein
VQFADRNARPSASSDVTRERERVRETNGWQLVAMPISLKMQAIVIVSECAIGGHSLTRTFDHLQLTRGLPQIIRTYYGKQFVAAR